MKSEEQIKKRLIFLKERLKFTREVSGRELHRKNKENLKIAKFLENFWKGKIEEIRWCLE